MIVAEPVQTGEVLTLHVWCDPEKVGDHVDVTVQDAPDYFLSVEAEAPSDGPLMSAKLAEAALWAWTHGGKIGLVAYLASQPGAWFDRNDPQKAF